MKKLTIKKLVRVAHQTAVEHGWWDGHEHGVLPQSTLAAKLALIHSEVSEALEPVRDNANPREIDLSTGVPTGFPIELADIVIRVADLCGFLGIDLEDALWEKLDHNEGRSYRHGGKAL